VADTPMLERAQKWLIHNGLERLHGPAEISCQEDDLVVLCLLRDGKPHLETFVEHHFSLGAKHLVFLDNGSTDGTIEALKEFDNVTVLRTRRPYRTYQVSMKQYLVERFGQGRWTLYADVDELFDYPYSDAVSLKPLLGYLNENRYTAVVTHMLDVFPEDPLSESAEAPEGGSLKERHRFYDLADVIVRDYSEAEGLDNVVANGGIGIYQGGVQKRLFGISPMLTKHSLVFLDGKLRPMDLSDHFAGGARVADFTGILLHYKLSSGLFGMVRREVEERSYPNRFGKYDKYAKVLEEAPELSIRSQTSRELRSVNELAHSGFLTVSEEYMALVDREDRKISEEPRALLRALSEANKALGPGAWRTANLQGREAGKDQWRVEQLRGELDREGRKAEHLERQIYNLKEYTGNLERQLRAMRSSKLWRLLTFIGRVRARLFSERRK
jgi:hypothetical protein